MYNEDDLLPLSYISQYGYCPRRAALLMNEQIWIENSYTVAGRAEHERVHTGRIESRKEKIELFDYTVSSLRLGLCGKCDCIEGTISPEGAHLPRREGQYALYPVEYKHGTVRDEPEYEMQLCAQAICLEEMYHISIPEGALFFIDAHRRKTVVLGETLRRSTELTAAALHEIAERRLLPPASQSPRCHKCSLRENCMPELSKDAAAYNRALRRQLLSQEDEPCDTC